MATSLARFKSHRTCVRCDGEKSVRNAPPSADSGQKPQLVAVISKNSIKIVTDNRRIRIKEMARVCVDFCYIFTRINNKKLFGKNFAFLIKIFLLSLNFLQVVTIYNSDILKVILNLYFYT